MVIYVYQKDRRESSCMAKQLGTFISLKNLANDMFI